MIAILRRARRTTSKKASLPTRRPALLLPLRWR